MKARVLAGAVLATTLLAGCAGTVSGSGSPGSAVSSAVQNSAAPSAPVAAPSSPDFPSAASSSASAAPTDGSGGSQDATASDTTCPEPYYAPAQLRFTCITPGMTAATDEIWPLLEVKQVDSSGWALQEGAARYTGSSTSLESIALGVRKAMVDAGAYLDSPKVVTLRIQTGKFGTRRAVIISSQITLNPAAAAAKKTKVKLERLWILAVQTSPGVVSLWHTSLPDLVKSLWAKVPAAIAAVQVST